MEVYSNTEKVSSENKIFKNKLLKENLSKEEEPKQQNDILSKINNDKEKEKTKISPQKKAKIQNYEETKIVKENEPNTKETYINVKSKVVFGDSNEVKGKNKGVAFEDPKEKKIDNNIIEKKNLNSLNESNSKPSEDDIINAELKKLSEKKTKTEGKNNLPAEKEKTKKLDVKNENEMIRNPNELPKKEKIDAEYINQKKTKISDKETETPPINIKEQSKISTSEEKKPPIEKPQISGKKVKKVNVAEPVKDLKKRESQVFV